MRLKHSTTCGGTARAHRRRLDRPRLEHHAAPRLLRLELERHARCARRRPWRRQQRLEREAVDAGAQASDEVYLERRQIAHRRAALPEVGRLRWLWRQVHEFDRLRIILAVFLFQLFVFRRRCTGVSITAGLGIFHFHIAAACCRCCIAIAGCFPLSGAVIRIDVVRDVGRRCAIRAAVSRFAFDEAFQHRRRVSFGKFQECSALLENGKQPNGEVWVDAWLVERCRSLLRGRHA
jgi:hypothetical protein